jgi:hypothetical protein
MAPISRRQDHSLIWLLAGGGIALVAILMAIIVGGVALFIAMRSPTLRASAGGPSLAGSATPASGRERLVGTWDVNIAARGASVMELRRDGTMTLIVTHKSGLKATIHGTWDVVSESGNRLGLRRTSPDSDGTVDIQFTDPNTFVVLGPNGGLVYRRR